MGQAAVDAGAGAGGRAAGVPLAHTAPEWGEPVSVGPPRHLPDVQRAAAGRSARRLLPAEADRVRRRSRVRRPRPGVTHRRLRRSAGAVSATSVGEVIELYTAYGGDPYDEVVTQLAHGLQCAALAAADGSGHAL